MIGLFLLHSALAGPHADQVAQFGHVDIAAQAPSTRLPAPLPPPSVGPDMKVYGYLAYWNDDLNSVPWDELSHIAIFGAEATTSGGLTETSRWDQTADAVALAQSYGVKVHLCVLNFSPSELGILLGSASSRAALISELAAWQASTGADGINVDFEGLPGNRRAEMVTFVQDLEAAVGEVVLATPSVDWSDAWDYAALTDHADLFIMGYGYHWSGASYAGPIDPLYAGSGTVWSGINSYSLSWSLNDYLSEGADPDRVIMGLPLYGMGWPTATDAVPSTALGTGGSIVFVDVWDLAGTHGSALDSDTQSRHTYDGVQQYWFGDVTTVRDRIAYARDVEGVGGIGFWALHYDGDDAAMWSMIHDETTWSTTTTTTTDPGTTSSTTDTGSTNSTTDPTTTATQTDGPGTNTNTDPTIAATLSGGPADQPLEKQGGCGCDAAPSMGLPSLLNVVRRR